MVNKMDDLKSWRELITTELLARSETWDDVFSCTMTDDELDVKFDAGYGTVSGEPFTLWTHVNVYFPVQYDGAEWVRSVSRLPDGKPTNHVGG